MFVIFETACLFFSRVIRWHSFNIGNLLWRDQPDQFRKSYSVLVIVKFMRNRIAKPMRLLLIGRKILMLILERLGVIFLLYCFSPDLIESLSPIYNVETCMALSATRFSNAFTLNFAFFRRMSFLRLRCLRLIIDRTVRLSSLASCCLFYMNYRVNNILVDFLCHEALKLFNHDSNLL